MKYNDNELISLCLDKHEEAMNILINKYKPVIINIINDFYKKYDIYGIDKSDLYQEGLIGLLNAVETYDKDKDILFFTYANACIKSGIMSEIRRTFRNKHRLLNNSISLDKELNDNQLLSDIIHDNSSNPDNILLDKEKTKEITQSLKKVLSKAELEIFNLRLNGLSNKEISSLINKDKKYVENTIFRIKNKYKKLGL